MTMPEAAIDKDDRAILAQHDGGVSGQPRMVEPVAEATAKEEFPHHHFWFGALPPYLCHTVMALLLCQFVCHCP